jgi:hypothetical protein
VIWVACDVPEPTVEIHVPISPTRPFFTMVRYLAASLHRNGGLGDRARLIVTVGADEDPRDLRAEQPWSIAAGVEWRWLPRERFRLLSFFATAADRLHHAFTADVVFMLDADTLVTGSLADLVADVHSGGRLHALVAHVSPFLEERTRSNREWWNAVFAAAELPPPVFDCRHSGWGVMTRDPEYRDCPAYFNGGVVVAPASVMSALGRSFDADLAAVGGVLDTYFRCQIAIALSVARGRLPWTELAIRYNYPNDAGMHARYAAEAADVRIFHYMRTGDLDKMRDFDGTAAVERLLARADLGDVNRELVRHLARVHADVVRSQ